MTDPLLSLQVKALRCARGHQRLRDGLSFEVRARGAIGISGANGSGKTTLLDTLCGLCIPLGGDVKVAVGGTSQIITRWSYEKRRAAGLRRLFQKSPGLPNRPLWELFESFGVLHRSSSSIANILWSVDNTLWCKTRLGECAPDQLMRCPNAIAGNLSFGQTRVLMISLLLQSGGKLLLLDEPTVGLSEEMRQHVSAAIRRSIELGACAIVADHDDAFLRSVCSEILVLG